MCHLDLYIKDRSLKMSLMMCFMMGTKVSARFQQGTKGSAKVPTWLKNSPYTHQSPLMQYIICPMCHLDLYMKDQSLKMSIMMSFRMGTKFSAKFQQGTKDSAEVPTWLTKSSYSQYSSHRQSFISVIR